MKNDYQAEINGHGDLQATLLLKSGWPAAGTRLQLLQNELAVKVLDYVAEGKGSVKLNLEEGGQRPDAHVEVLLENAFFKRQHEDKAFIEGVDLQLQALVKDMTFNGPGEDLTLHLRIPAAKVTDMRVYNLYLPENSPLQFLGGEADLVADIELQPHSARGYVTLKTDKLRSRLDEQEVSGDVTANINIAGGTPKNMDFDISGSTLLLDNIRVIGNQEKLEESDWHARVSFTRANTVWKKPVLLKAEADIEMQDSTPIVAMLSNHRNKNGWIEKMLTVGKIEGEAQVDMQKNQILFPYAFAGSDEIDVGARGVITEQTRDGVIFARYRKLKGLLKIRDGKRSFDVIKAQQKFDDYSPEALIK
jgi:translocation and assembly module TamB